MFIILNKIYINIYIIIIFIILILVVDPVSYPSECGYIFLYLQFRGSSGSNF